MGLKNPWQKRVNNTSKLNLYSLLLQSFYFLSITILSLLLPLSFLLLARISSAQFLFSTQTHPSNQNLKASFLTSIFLYTNPTFLHALVSIIAISSLVHTITGRIRVEQDQPARPRLMVAWIFLCALQVCVGLGIEASIAAEVDGTGFSKGRSFFGKAAFFIGLHEVMMYWCRSVVKPVVDDTVWGEAAVERWVERAAMAVGCGAIWWLRLKEEVEALVGVLEVKMESFGGGVGIGDFVGWWLYYVVIAIGIARVLKGGLWVVMVMFFKRWEEGINGGGIDESLVVDEDHV